MFITDPRTTKLAEILVNYSTKVQPGDWVKIMAGLPALPLVDEVVKVVLKVGGYPSIAFSSDQLYETYLSYANDEQLKWLAPDTLFGIEKVDVLMSIRAPENIRILSGIDPKRQQMARKEWLEIYRKRSASGDLQGHVF